MTNEEKQKRINELREQRRQILRRKRKIRKIQIAMIMTAFVMVVVGIIWGAIKLAGHIISPKPIDYTI
ncbi:MAG: hypothetical protein IJ054_05130, partial [Lachnospiraceae bacterium]|nr:hypothetical protein [Lachnospiraceae bacterium]